jgi:hypothetical protein
MDQSLIEAALSWAKKGVPVFPCAPSKKPLTENGHLNASTDPMKVRAMFEFAGDDILIGARMGAESRLFACDFDLYKPGAKEYMEELAGRGLLTDTQVHLTRSGGLHFLYRSDNSWPNCQPHQGVEIKGEGGYIIVPPSPGYSIQKKGIANASKELVRELVEARRIASKSSIDQLKARILSADDFHDSLAALAARLSGRGLSQAEVQRSLIEVLSASVASAPAHARHERWRSLMKDAGGELSRLSATSHEKYNHTVAGERVREIADEGLVDNLVNGSAGFFARSADRPDGAGSRVDDLLKILPSEGDWPFAAEGYFSGEDREILDQRYIMYPLFAERETVLMAAEPKAGKTAISLRMAMAVSMGENLGSGTNSFAIAEARPTLYFTLEGARAVEMRIAAERGRRKDSGLDWPTKDKDMLFVVDRPQNLLFDQAQTEFCAKVIAHDRKCKEVFGVNLGLIFIDTLTKAMPGGDQNSVEDTSKLFKITDTLRERGVTACIVFIHHLSKQGAVRGSTNIEAEVDVVTSVEKSKTQGVINLVIRRARSIDEAVSYGFRLTSYYLGETVQGHRLSAPVVDMLTTDESSTTAEGARAAAKWAKVCTALITGLGVGKHSGDKLMAALANAGFIDVGSSRRPNSTGAVIQKQLQALFDGKHNWSYGDYWFAVTRDGDTVVGFELRDTR